MNKKYKLTSETMTNVWGTTLFQIEATVSFGNVEKGEKGGWVEKEENLSHEDDAWVYGNARVYGNAWVSGNARVSGDARVSGNAQVSGDARVSGNARVSGDAQVYGNAWVSGNARVYGNARVSGDARVYGNAWVSGNAQVSGDARVSGNAWVSGDAQVSGKIKLTMGYFFGWRSKDAKLTFVDTSDGDELIGKDDCKFEYYEEKKDSVAEETIALLESNGYKIVKE